VEWVDCSDIFFANNLHDEAEYCSVKAIDSLGKLPGMPAIPWTKVISVFVRGRLAPVASREQGRLNFLAIADRLSDAKSALTALRQQRGQTAKSTTVLTQADVSLSESIMLARDSSRYSRVQLAAKFRKYNPFKGEFKWDRPEIAVGIMNEHLLKYPDDTAALCVRASAFGDLGMFDLGIADAKAALKINPENIIALTTAGRLLLGANEGFEAWTYIKKAFDSRPSLPSAAMLLTSCAVSAMKPNLSEKQEKLVSVRRRYVSSIIGEQSVEHSRSGESNLDRITIQFLIFNLKFVEVIKFVQEIESEGHHHNFRHWNDEIDRAILRAGQSIKQNREQAEKITKDVFPD
jgi:hypothetical protein